MNAAGAVHIFWDGSNMFIPARFAAANFGEAAVSGGVRLQLDNVYYLARGGRQVHAAYCVASASVGNGPALKRVAELGVEVEIFERGRESGCEQGVDQALQARMLRTLVDVETPGVAVLMTGDGAGYTDGVGFHADLERLHQRGWGVEVISWDAACSSRLKEWAKEVGVYVPLDRFYRQVTYVEGGRRSQALSMKGRGWAAPQLRLAG